MPIVPLRQKVTVIRSGGEDDWGVPLPDERIEMKARVDELTKTVQNRHGQEVVSSMQIMLNKMADVNYDDTIEYTDELGRTTTRQPLKIEPIRMINSKAILTFVYL